MEEKKTRGRPVKNEVNPLPATAEQIAKAIFHGADKKLSATYQEAKDLNAKI